MSLRTSVWPSGAGGMRAVLWFHTMTPLNLVPIAETTSIDHCVWCNKHVWMLRVGAGSEPAPTNNEGFHCTVVASTTHRRVGAGSEPAPTNYYELRTFPPDQCSIVTRRGGFPTRPTNNECSHHTIVALTTRKRVGAGSEPAPTNYEHSHQTNVALPRVGRVPNPPYKQRMFPPYHRGVNDA